MRNFAPRAQADLDDVVSWLLDGGGSAASAERLLDAVLDAADKLASRPHLGRRRPALLPDRFRFWSLPGHRLLLIYRAEPAPAVVLRVVSTDRDLATLLTDLG